MEMVGGGKMLQYPATDECPHKIGAEPNWQESYVLVWWDSINAVGGHFRIGHEPNQNGGEANLWAQVHVPGKSYFRNSTLPIIDVDRFDNGLGAGNGALTFRYDGQCRWQLEDDDIKLSLALEDFHPAIDGYIKDGEAKMGQIQSHHVEVACRVTGEVTAKGKTYQIDGLGMRDHGWGPRDWSAIWAHRWLVGTFDRDNSFCAVSMHLSTDTIVRFGWVVREDKVIYADHTEIIAHILNDGATNAGGVLRMKLSTGESFEASFTPVAPASLFYHRGLSCVDTLSRVTWGTRVGVGVFETSGNLQAGLRRPELLDGGLAVNGWHSTSARQN